MKDEKVSEKNEEIKKPETEELFEKEGTSSGKRLVWFLTGLGLFGGGTFLVTQNTILSSRFSLMDILGINPPFGLVILPLLIGIGVLFFNEKSVIGWVLTIVGLAAILLGVLMNLSIFFKPVTLYQGILMFGLIAAGIGLISKALANTK